MNRLSLEGRKVVVVGLGASGLAAAEVALARGAKVVLNDGKGGEAFGAKLDPFVTKGAVLALGGHPRSVFEGADLVVVSPGVPPFAELDEAARSGAEVIGEVEFAVRLAMETNPSALLFAIGGTNGKSTVTTLVGELLGKAFPRVFVGGNLGEPLAAHVFEPFDAIVLEVSSFQMERAPTFHPTSASLLNVTDDHLDRYPSFDAYADAKGNAFVNQGPGDLAIVPEGDRLCLRQASRGNGAAITFGIGKSAVVRIEPDALVDTRNGERYSRAAIRLAGEHNAANVAAAIAMVGPYVAPHAIREVLGAFRGLAHRTELVQEIGGVRYYDDSKGTNVGATVTALLGLSEAKGVLIAGGREKGGSYAPLMEALRMKGRAVVLIGEATEAMAGAFAGVVPIHRAKDMDEAVEMAANAAQPGDAVLLSPACSSFDMFRDYKHRGEEFVRSVGVRATRGR